MALNPSSKLSDDAKAKIETERQTKGDKHWILNHILRLLRDAPLLELRRAGATSEQPRARIFAALPSFIHSRLDQSATCPPSHPEITHAQCSQLMHAAVLLSSSYR